MLVFFGIGALFYTYVLITFLPETRSPLASFALVAVGYIILTGYTSINALVRSELFPVHVRALGVGVGYAPANSIFGGTAPLIYRGGVAGGLCVLPAQQVRDVSGPRAGFGVPGVALAPSRFRSCAGG
jgi:MFS transporter, MHS family, alpha-ketoglutarate permease